MLGPRSSPLVRKKVSWPFGPSVRAPADGDESVTSPPSVTAEAVMRATSRFMVSLLCRMVRGAGDPLACPARQSRPGAVEKRRRDRSTRDQFAVNAHVPWYNRRVEYRLLGSFQVLRDGVELPFGGVQQRAVLT